MAASVAETLRLRKRCDYGKLRIPRGAGRRKIAAMESFELKRILVAISNPLAGSNRAVRRAVELARRTGAALEFFNAIRSPGFAYGVARAEALKLMRAAAAQNLAALDRMAKPLRREELLIETTVHSGDVLHEVILRRARSSGADLIVIEAHEHSVFARVLLKQMDFELIRRSPVPLLIVKGSRAWRAPRVLAALDPFHTHDKPRGLDATIVAAANTVATALAGTVHVTHSYWPLAELFPNAVMEPTVMAVTPAQDKQYEATVRGRFAEDAERYGIAKRYRHLRRGDPAVQLPILVRSLKASVVVMGAVSRTGLRRLFIGSTAERLLDRLPCDVLIVRPDLRG